MNGIIANENLSAYPHGQDSYAFGLTKREEFAKAAMQGLLANPQVYQEMNIDDVVKSSRRHADALLAELAMEKSTS